MFYLLQQVFHLAWLVTSLCGALFSLWVVSGIYFDPLDDYTCEVENETAED